MKVHDQRIQYLDDLNKLVKRDATKGSIIGMRHMTTSQWVDRT